MGDLRARARSGEEVRLTAAVVGEFRSRLRGPLLTPDDHGYEDARQIWNGMHDKRPALIARCSGAADVIDAVNFARDHHLLAAVADPRRLPDRTPGRQRVRFGAMFDAGKGKGGTAWRSG